MKAPSDIVLAVAGNKSDLDGQRAVATEEAREYSNSIDAIYFETSARTAHNVLLLFEDISKDCSLCCLFRGLSGPYERVAQLGLCSSSFPLYSLKAAVYHKTHEC